MKVDWTVTDLPGVKQVVIGKAREKDQNLFADQLWETGSILDSVVNLSGTENQTDCVHDYLLVVHGVVVIKVVCKEVIGFVVDDANQRPLTIEGKVICIPILKNVDEAVDGNEQVSNVGIPVNFTDVVQVLLYISSVRDVVKDHGCSN